MNIFCLKQHRVFSSQRATETGSSGDSDPVRLPVAQRRPHPGQLRPEVSWTPRDHGPLEGSRGQGKPVHGQGRGVGDAAEAEQQIWVR